MRPRTATHPIWFVSGITPVPCPLAAGLACEIPITRLQFLADGAGCSRDGCCSGHNHPNPAVSAQAKEELDWHTSH